jgi:hypothetical protein
MCQNEFTKSKRHWISSTLRRGAGVFSGKIVVSKLGTCGESFESAGEGDSVSELDMDDSKNLIGMPIVVESH